MKVHRIQSYCLSKVRVDSESLIWIDRRTMLFLCLDDVNLTSYLNKIRSLIALVDARENLKTSCRRDAVFWSATQKRTFFICPGRSIWRLQFIYTTIPQKYSPNLVLCSRHFEDDCFTNINAIKIGFASRLILREGSGPSLFGSSSSSESQPVSIINIINCCFYVLCSMLNNYFVLCTHIAASRSSMSIVLKYVQGSQVSRIERDSHSFRSFVTLSRHTLYFSRWKTICSIFNMPQRPKLWPRRSNCGTGRNQARLLWCCSSGVVSQSENSTIVSG